MKQQQQRKGEETDPVIIIAVRARGANHNIHSAGPGEKVEVGLERIDRETDR